MSSLPADPFTTGIAEFARDFRAGKRSSAEVTRACLDRIAALDPKLGAFELVDEAGAMATSEAMDALRGQGIDLGPLMGVPIGVKDIIAVEGAPTTNGSNWPTEDLTGPEGTIVKQLKRAGCVILGKTKTVEFALGASGVNEVRGTPWNPWDARTHRTPGGSSSGSGVATAAGLCAFALGTDTGGSVRIPACLNGLFGHKTTVGLWPTDGVFPLSPTLDSIGPLTRNAEDAAIVHAVITGERLPQPARAETLRLGKPTNFFFDDLDPEVASAFAAAESRLSDAGVEIVEIEIPEAVERERLFPAIVPVELLSRLTVDEFQKRRNDMDPTGASRAAHGLTVTGIDYCAAQVRRQELEKIADGRFEGLDGWIAPTCAMLPLSVPGLSDPEVHARSLLSSRNTQPANIFVICATTLPIHQFGSDLPVGLQLMAPQGEDARLLSMSQGLEAVLGAGASPDVSAFL